MKIISFNINGIKSFTKFIRQKFNLSFNEYLIHQLKVDILCLQEVKCNKKDMDEFKTLKDYITLTNLNQHKNGIYGVSTIISKKLYCRKHNIKVPYSDHGRSILTDHKDFKILNLYCPFYDPNGTKTKESVIKFYQDIFAFIKNYDDLIVLGDFNATYSVFDHFVYYNEYVKVYERKVDSQHHVLEILEKFPDPFEDVSFLDSYKKVFSRHDDEIGNLYKDDTKHPLCQLLGKNVFKFMCPSNSPYLKFIYSSLCGLQDTFLTFLDPSQTLSDAFTDKDIDYKMDLLEKSFFSQTELPFLIDNVSTLLLLFYSTFQRKWMLKFMLRMSHIDVFRVFNSGYEKYTCWNTQLNLRPVNLGSRIDYILVPIKFFNMVVNSDILENEYGSDHCPIFVNLNIEVNDDKDNICKIRNNLLGFLKKKN